MGVFIIKTEPGAGFCVEKPETNNARIAIDRNDTDLEFMHYCPLIMSQFIYIK